MTQWRQLVSCDWSSHSRGSLIPGEFRLKIYRSTKTLWQKYSGVACSYSEAPGDVDDDDKSDGNAEDDDSDDDDDVNNEGNGDVNATTKTLIVTLSTMMIYDDD